MKLLNIHDLCSDGGKPIKTEPGKANIAAILPFMKLMQEYAPLGLKGIYSYPKGAGA